MNKIAFLMLFPISLMAQLKPYKGPYGMKDLEKVPSAPRYDQLNYWIAHPDQEDLADMVPGRGQLVDYQSTADVDVFFIYPTIYKKKQNPETPWFADVNDPKLNERIANSTIKYQATVFNGSARVYAPLYRQAHLGVFYVGGELKEKALDMAYQDVKTAFDYYLEHFHAGRPIIIASHSQGTIHAVRLLHEYFEGKELMEKLVAAYIIGMPVRKDEFKELPVCKDPAATGCWLTWNTYLRGHYPPNHKAWYENALSVNPLNWKADGTYASRGMNKGGVLKNFKKIIPGLTDAQNQDGMLWAGKPRFFGNFLLRRKRYHVVDYNLFYLNIRENVEVRIEKYLSKYPESGRIDP